MHTNQHSALAEAISDFLLWMISKRYADRTCYDYELILRHFLAFIKQMAIPWEAIFTWDTLNKFQQQSGLAGACKAPRTLSRYLYEQNRIQRPVEKPTQELPNIYEQYIDYYARIKSVSRSGVLCVRNSLSALNNYLQNRHIALPDIKIDHIDAFLAAHNANRAPATQKIERSNIRGFLTYLRHVRGIIKTDLAPLVIGAPLWAQSKPPKFLRPHEVQQLFASLSSSSTKALRTTAMVHLAYTLGLRPKEISLICLDDISFTRAEITLGFRKSDNPIKLPLPESTIKAIAAYIIGARPKSDERAVFLNLLAPYKPISPAKVSHHISVCMKQVNPASSAYWLRHTYAQNLLESNASIFEIKQMLGHDKIQTTQRYIHIHTRLMREVLFDETL